MKVIILRGNSNVGKTTTLNLVYDNLLKNGSISSGKRAIGDDVNDFSDLVTYKNQRIYFFTMGDYSGYLTESIKNCNLKNYDILICAVNSKFVKPFIEIRKYEHNIIDKTVEVSLKLQNDVNNHDAEIILSLI